MASAKIAIVCGLKARVGCQNKLYMNSDADETLAQGSATYGPPGHFTGPQSCNHSLSSGLQSFFCFKNSYAAINR